MNRKALLGEHQYLLVLFIIGIVLTTLSVRSHAESDAVVRVGPFSIADEGSAVPAGWEPLTFDKIQRHTQYQMVNDEDTTVVRATSEAAASGLIRKVKIDLKEYPVLKWRWKVENIISKGDITTQEGDDYAARIYITFQYEPDKVGFQKKVKHKIGRLLFGDVPIAAINYIWGSRALKGTIADSAYTGLSKLIVVESGDENVGIWVDEERNVYEDYQEAFGEEPPLVNGIVIMTDTDNTGESAVAYYGDITFKKVPLPM